MPAEDARICCLLALDRHTTLRELIPHGEIAGELRAIARDDERAARDHVRLLNRLRADLQITYPAALVLAGGDLGAPTMLRLLARWPTQPELARASREELVGSPASARAQHHSRSRCLGAPLSARHRSSVPCPVWGAAQSIAGY